MLNPSRDGAGKIFYSKVIMSHVESVD